MEGLMSRSGKKLSTFTFERQNIAGCCKETFHFQFNIKLIKGKTCFFQFSQNGRKNSNYFTLMDLDNNPSIVYQIFRTLTVEGQNFVVLSQSRKVVCQEYTLNGIFKLNNIEILCLGITYSIMI